MLFNGIFWMLLNFMLLFGIFLHYLGIWGLLRCFVAILFCHDLRIFLGKIFFGWNHVCVKKVFFLHVCFQWSLNILPATRAESTNSILVVPDNNKSSLTKQKCEVVNSCKFCSSKFESLNYFQNHVKKFDENNWQLKCTFYAQSFSNKNILDAHITSVHQKENSRHTIEREPSLSNHKQKKLQALNTWNF